MENLILTFSDRSIRSDMEEGNYGQCKHIGITSLTLSNTYVLLLLW